MKLIITIPKEAFGLTLDLPENLQKRKVIGATSIGDTVYISLKDLPK